MKTLQELEQLRKQWIAENMGFIKDVAMAVNELGSLENIDKFRSAKVIRTDDGYNAMHHRNTIKFDVSIDGWAVVETVIIWEGAKYWNNQFAKTLCLVGYGDQPDLKHYRFVPGDWMKYFIPYIDNAKENITKREENYKNTEVDKYIKMLYPYGENNA